MPSEENGDVGLFDRFADLVAGTTSRAWFFAACAALIVIWLPSYFVVGSFDTWQLLINTPTTCITFLLVALLQNTQKRSDDAMHQKLNALAAGMTCTAEYLMSNGQELATIQLRDSMRELRESVGLEERESSSS